MTLQPLFTDRSAYLQSCEVIDWRHPQVVKLARKLAEKQTSDTTIAKRCFEWVRDCIKHSWDYRMNPVTCNASEVLEHQTGYCYAKSHLLAALLRANGIPAGLCYQRLSLSGEGAPYCLHGLNTVYLEQYGWYRLDPRGNNVEVNSQFEPPREQLAFASRHPEERDFPEIHAWPLPVVVDALQRHNTFLSLFQNLPDYR